MFFAYVSLYRMPWQREKNSEVGFVKYKLEFVNSEVGRHVNSEVGRYENKETKKIFKIEI